MKAIKLTVTQLGDEAGELVTQHPNAARARKALLELMKNRGYTRRSGNGTRGTLEDRDGYSRAAYEITGSVSA